MYFFDLTLKQWQENADMVKRRSNHSSFVLKDTLFVYGGTENNREQHSIEFVSVKNGIEHPWQLRKFEGSYSLGYCVSKPALCALNDHQLLIVGGKETHVRYSQAVQRFNSTTGGGLEMVNAKTFFWVSCVGSSRTLNSHCAIFLAKYGDKKV